jgi:hypothetical protein
LSKGSLTVNEYVNPAQMVVVIAPLFAMVNFILLQDSKQRQSYIGSVQVSGSSVCINIEQSTQKLSLHAKTIYIYLI